MTHLQRVPSVAGEIQISKREAGEHVASKHLANRLQVELETGHAILGAKNEHENGRENRRNDKSPPRQSRLHNVKASETDGKAEYEHSTPPPERHFRIQVSKHELVMGVYARVALLPSQTLFRRFLVLPEAPELRVEHLLDV